MPALSHDSQTPTPPPLYHSPAASDKGRESTRDNTPVQTPKVSEASWPSPSGPSGPSGSFGPSRKDKEKDLYFSWHKKSGGAKRISNPLLGADWHFTPDPEEPLFEDDDGGHSAFPLFPDSPPHKASSKMTPVVPLDISLPPRLNSQSPRNHTSNLTFALQEAGASGQPVDTFHNVSSGLNAHDSSRLSAGGKTDPMSNMFGGSSYYGGSGARPISVKDRQRRESNTGGSFMGGMSWGGSKLSVGSWLRDDVMMAGTSPAANFPRSPSLHSSSYLPKMEANFLKDYACCGVVLDSLHELLEHFEKHHAQASSQAAQRSSVSSQSGLGNRRPSNGTSTVDNSRGFTGLDFQRQPQGPPTSSAQTWRQQSDNYTRTQLATVQDMDTLEDMEMDDSTAPITAVAQLHPQYNQSNSAIDALNTSMAPTMSAQQAFGRTSTPSTPIVANQAFSLFSNPTVSSVNTPALNTQSQTRSPDTSIPGTPAELDPNFNINFMSGMGYPSAVDMGLQDNYDFGNLGGFGNITNTIGEMTIDDPAKRLFSKQAGVMTNQQMQYAIKNGQVPMDSEMAKRLREQQLVGGLGGPIVGFPEPETKPFRCPVIGCEKAYKNQNGLKYHKQHGHQNQKLKENPDGTFSIVDPVTSIPYPGTVGMEKEKPYRCEQCGKRYKNLNGLKYHRLHSPACNPELKPTGNNNTGLPLQGLGPNANIAGAGLAGF